MGYNPDARPNGFSTKGLGSLLDWINVASESDNGYYALTDKKTIAHSRLTVPTVLLDFARDALVTRFKLTPTEAHGLTNSKIMIFLILSLVEDREQQMALAHAFDGGHGEQAYSHRNGSFVKMFNALNKRADDPLAGKSDRDLLVDNWQRSQATTHALSRLNDTVRSHHDANMTTVNGLMRVVTWLWADRLGMLPGRYPQSDQEIAGALNADNILKLDSLLMAVGKEESKRQLEHHKK